MPPMPDSRVLILMRHAEAAHPGGLRDHDRPLSAHGWRDAVAAGQWIRAQVSAVEAVLCSTAARTRQTLQATGITAPVEFVEFVDDLYGGGIDDIVEVISRAPAQARTLLVIGHAPGIAATAYELATTAQSSSSYSGSNGATAGDDGSIGGESASSSAESPALQRLRHFSACAFAVLSTDGDWAGIGERGADLTDVHHPGD